jgi:senataxin
VQYAPVQYAPVQYADSKAKATDTAAYRNMTLDNRVLTVEEEEVARWTMRGCTDRFSRYLREKFNPSQVHAIHAAVDQQGFTLVQGPPGTGKTSTIIGILNAIHIREYNNYYKLAVDAIVGPEGQRCRTQPYEHPWLKLIAVLSSSKPRILVVAPSNAAVDNVAQRIMEGGFKDGNGGQYFPNILRVGLGGNKNPKIKSITLETLTERKMARAAGATTVRREMINDLNVEITGMIKELVFLQSMLVNLQLAFQQSHPLPHKFEIRVNQQTGLPYWVDHGQKSMSNEPPAVQLRKDRGLSRDFTSMELLPEYVVYSHKLTRLVTQMDEANTRRNHLQALRSLQDTVAAVNLRELTESSVMDAAQILFTTLNSAGHPSMEATEFCVTVIDEAAQVRLLLLGTADFLCFFLFIGVIHQGGLKIVLSDVQ